jgi:Legume lectin domain/Chitobiase/beta-hexosaminidase C-terminal domain
LIGMKEKCLTGAPGGRANLSLKGLFPQVWSTILLAFTGLPVFAQYCVQPANCVLTANYNISRNGTNPHETVLTPGNVNTSSFGKLFSIAVDGFVVAQPLYVSNVVIGGKTHNVVYVATEHDTVYAFDADTNGGANANPLWTAYMLATAHGAQQGATTVPATLVSTADLVPEIGITGTPVIDSGTGTLYVVSKTLENGVILQRLHALDITSGAEKFGAPVQITATAAGTGNGSVNGVITFDSQWALQRPGLLLLNGVVYIGFAAHGDNGPYHGWILGYDAKTLKQTGAFCSSPNGFGNGIWMSGVGLAADQVNSAWGRMFVVTGNGTYGAGTASDPASPGGKQAPAGNNYGDTVLNLDLTNGKPTVTDFFTPATQLSLASSDFDLGSGGVALFPGPGDHPNLLVLVGKTYGFMYVLDRDKLGGYGGMTNGTPNADNIYQEVKNETAGMWGNSAFWDSNVYTWGIGDQLREFPFTGGLFATSPFAYSSEWVQYPSTTPAVTSNGNTNGIIWNIIADQYVNNGSGVLIAHDATNVSTTLYSSSNTAGRDDPGPPVKFGVPTVVSGKVYVGGQGRLTVFGLFNGNGAAAAPAITPGSETINAPIQVTMATTTSGAAIYYTTDGTVPTASSKVYSGPITISSTTTVRAVASAQGLLQSAVTSATYTLVSQIPAPTFSPGSGTYSVPQNITISDTNSGATFYYTLDGSTPTTGSAIYSGPVVLSKSGTIKAIAVATGKVTSTVASATYVAAVPTYDNGFSDSKTTVAFTGSTDLDDSRLQLTNGGTNQAGSAFYETPVNITSFETTFKLQISAATGEGMTFVIQGNSPTALGGSGSGLGYAGIGKSVALKFDIANNAGEGTDSTGLYTNGAAPTVPSINLSGTPINLISGNTFLVDLAYKGTVLTLAITDTVTNGTWSHQWTVNIPSIVGGNTAYVGFTGGTSNLTTSQKVLVWTWNYVPVNQAATPAISPAPGEYPSAQTISISDTTAGAKIYYTLDGTTPTAASNLYSAPFQIVNSLTLKAMAVAPGYLNSTLALANYTIDVPNYTNGFAGAGSSLALNGTARISGSALQLISFTQTTNHGAAYYATPLNVQKFTTDFTFQLANANGDGFTFLIQGDGASALGATGGGLGFADLANSVAIKFDLYDNGGEGNDSTGLFTDGAFPSVPASNLATSGIDLHSGHVFAVHLNYNGAALALTITDQTTNVTFSQQWTINIPGTVGGNTAYVGFSAGNGGATATMDILSWSFKPQATATAQPLISPAGGLYTNAIPVSISSATSGANIYYTLNGSTPTSGSTPYTGAFTVSKTTVVKAIAVLNGSTNSAVTTANFRIGSGINYSSYFVPSGLTLNGSALVNGKALQLTAANQPHTAGSAFYNSPVNVQNFATRFTFQLSNASGDGFGFTLQGVGPAALGGDGGGLGTAGMASSVMVKFDLYNNDGEGSSSTGVYLNGAWPSVPAVDMAGSGIDLHSGHVFTASITYDGTTLSLTVQDQATNATFQHDFVVNIPGTVGFTTAYVGFTGGVGGTTATQDILNWIYVQ